MLRDIGSAYKGDLSYITIPTPLRGVAPMTHISFKGDADTCPPSLQISNKGSKSRRLVSYTLNHASNETSTPLPKEQEIHTPDTNKPGSSLTRRGRRVDSVDDVVNIDGDNFEEAPVYVPKSRPDSTTSRRRVKPAIAG